MDLNPFGYSVTFDFDFQVWRPSPTVSETGCYSLVNNFAVKETSLPSRPETEYVARVTPLPQNQLQFQPGDVLGFYVESHGTGDVLSDNGVVLLNNASFTSELVWFASIDITAQTSQSGSCPYPAGTTGVLDSSTHAAPVISVSVTTYPCPRSLSITFDPSPTLVPNLVTTSPSLATEFIANSKKDVSIAFNLVVGISVSTGLIIIFIATVTVVIVTVLYYCKIRKHRRTAVVSNGIRPTGEQLDTPLQEVMYDYPQVNPTIFVVLEENQAYTEGHGTSTSALSFDLQENEAYMEMNSSSITLTNNQAYVGDS